MTVALDISLLYGLMVIVLFNTILVLRGLEKIHQEIRDQRSDDRSDDRDSKVKKRDKEIAFRK